MKRARQAASRYLAARGYEEEGRIAASGQGDDFAEVRIAIQLLMHEGERQQRLEKALLAYADPAFWDSDLPGTAPADNDRGRTARHALAGRDPPMQSYD